nr:sulfatase-like hydrolase/transferase [Gammaproteobacteria bacterium]
VIVFTSDHGEQLGDHRLLGKMGFYDQSYHIPLLIRDPDSAIAANTATTSSKREVSVFTESVDVMPTLLDLLGAAVPPQLDGRSLKPWLKGESVENWRRSAHWEFDFREIISRDAENTLGLPSQLCNLSVIRDEHFKYVHFAGLPPLLFDLEQDPAEQRNVAEVESYQNVRLYLAEKLLRWRAEHLDQSLALKQLSVDGVVG